MLNLSLAAISRGGAHARWEIPPDHPLWQDTELSLAGPVHVQVEARPIGDGGVLVRGRVQATVSQECRRCTARVEARVDEPLDLLFEPLAAEEADALAGEVYPLPTRGDELDLGESLREQLLLHVPDLVLCTEACRGLCPQCGTNLNESQCTCVPDPEPGPWDALKNLKFD